jgi:hypothetical protein
MATKSKISLEALNAYMRAIALHRAPLPVDPIARQEQQREFYLASEAMRVALDRGRHRVPILETLASDDVPFYIICRGPAFVDDYRGAIKIRKELERLTREVADAE